MAITFDHANKLINIAQVDAQPLLIQTLVNAIRAEEASERGIVYDQIMDAAGKDSLGGSVQTAITMSLRSTWKLRFEPGAYQATIDGGNLADGLAKVDNTGNPQVLLRMSAAATIAVTGSGVTDQDKTDIANRVLSAAQSSPIYSDMRKAVGTSLKGDGTEGNKFRSVLVP